MNAALTINQLLGSQSAPESIFLFNNPANDLSVQELAAIHGGSLTLFEKATIVVAAAAVIVAGGAAIAAAGYVVTGLVTVAAGTGAAVGAAATAVYH